MALIGEHHVHGCPYPLTVTVKRFKVKGRFKYASLVRYGPPPALTEWFNQYNARQIIEDQPQQDMVEPVGVGLE